MQGSHSNHKHTPHTDMFAFDLYDTDGSGELSPPEVLKLLQEIFGKEEMKTNIHAKRYVDESCTLTPL